MQKGALLGALFSFACTETAFFDDRSHRPIIGGQRSAAGDHLETGVLLSIYDFGGGQKFGSFACTGTLIAPDVVMTAAHCTLDFFDGSVPFHNYFSFALDVSDFGMNTLALPADAIEFHELIPHPMFDINRMPTPGLGNWYDVGIGFLEDSFTTRVPGVVADGQDALLLTVGSTVAIVGYGQTTATSTNAGIKYQAISFINEINQHEMQIGDAPPTDPQKCHGDSGGPTFIDIADGREPLRRVIGITSRAYDEADCNKGGIDMRADAYRDWFDQMMRDRCTNSVRTLSVCANGGGLPLPGDAFVPPAVDAGFPDTGVPVDIGVEIKPDAHQLEEDAGMMMEGKDAGVTGGMDASLPFSRGGRTTRDDGCACSSNEHSEGDFDWLLLGIVLIARAVSPRGSWLRIAR